MRLTRLQSVSLIRALHTVLLFVCAALASGLLAWLFRDAGGDDPYITYRYARNLARGLGFVYNPGEPVLSTTTPGYALLLVPFVWLGLELPLVSVVLSCSSLVLGGVALWQLAKAWGMPLPGTLALILYPLFPLLFPTIGNEVPVYLALVLFALHAYVRKAEQRAALLLALATLMRPEAVLAAGVLASHRLLFRRRPFPWPALLVYGALLLPWLLFSWLYFGSPIPITLEAKQWQALMPITENFLRRLVMQAGNYWASPWYRLHLLLAAWGLAVALLFERRWLLLLSWNLLYAMTYILLNVPGYPWYYGTLAPGWVVLISLGGSGLCRLLPLPARRQGLCAALLLSLLVLPQLQTLQRFLRQPDVRLGIYRAVGEWLQAQTPPNASVGTLEVGAIGYYSQRHMIDFAGLLQPDIAQHVAGARNYEDAAIELVRRFRPSHLVLQDGSFPRLERELVPAAGCRRQRVFRDVRYPYRLVVYECQW